MPKFIFECPNWLILYC